MCYGIHIMSELAVNRRAGFDYEILQTYEAGIELFGFEVKAAKAGRMQIAGAFVVIRNTGASLVNATIAPYQPKNTPGDYDPARSRRLLLHASELKELLGASSRKGLTIVPVKAYTKRNRIKLLIGLGRHKKKQDRRETIKRREAEREAERET